MKTFFSKILFTLLTILAGFQICISQDQNSPQKIEARLIDEFGKACSEEVAARYDSYAMAVLSDSAAVGYIVFHGDKSIEGTNLNYIKFLTEYGINRGLDSSHLKIIRGENQDSMKISFWLVPFGAEHPKIEKPYEIGKILETVRYDKSWADFRKFFGEKEIYHGDFFGDWGCDFEPNVKEFAKILLSDEDLMGYLVIYGNKESRAEKVVKFAVNDLVKNHKVPRNRLKTIYGGKSEEPQIEFWFVPKNGKLPVINPK